MNLDTGCPAHPTMLTLTGPARDPFGGPDVPEGQSRGTLLMGPSWLDQVASEQSAALINRGASVTTEDDCRKLARAAYSVALALIEAKRTVEAGINADNLKKAQVVPPKGDPLSLADLLPSTPGGQVVNFPSKPGPTAEEPPLGSKS